MDPALQTPWLVAAWPGMGQVAVGALQHLVETLGAEPWTELPAGDHFDLTEIAVHRGVIAAPTPPRSRLLTWRRPAGGGPDLVLFLGDAQPNVRGLAFCEQLLDRAAVVGVTRVVTFAAMASPAHPQAPARVFAAANRAPLVEDLAGRGAERLGEGQISGMNGVLLAAATARELEGLCLLGEFPYFATALPNPKASAAVLRVFEDLADLEIDCTALDEHARSMESRLATILERLQQAAQAQAVGMAPPGAAEPGEPASRPRLTPADAARIDRLFSLAARDREQAVRLKAELDRLGVFKDYEDRFLDLFKQGG